MMIKEVPIPADVSWVRLREADEEECRAGGMTGAHAVAIGRDTSHEAHMILIDDEVVGFWGYRYDGGINYWLHAWFLTMPGMDAHGVRLARCSKKIVEYLKNKAPIVLCEVHVEHTKACRWLEWLGFIPAYAPHNGFQYMITRRD